MTSSTSGKRERFIDIEWSIRPVFIVSALLASVGSLLLSLIAQLPAGLATIEPSTAVNTLKVTRWLTMPAEPLYWPFYALVQFLGMDGVDVRYLSAGFALVSIIGMYAVFQIWFNRYYAGIGSLLMVCNTLFLSLALYATPGSFVLFYVIFSLLAVTLLYRGKSHGYLLGGATVALSLYVGLVGIIVGAMQIGILTYVLMRRRLHRPDTKIAGLSALILLMVATPAVYVAARGYYAFLEFPIFTTTNTLEILKLLTIGSTNNRLLLPETWPLLEIGSFALLVLGTMVSITRRKADRYKLLLGLFVVALTALLFDGQRYALLAFLLVPMVVLITTGLRYISDMWTSVFPKNKAAAIIAHSTSVLIVIAICTYHLVRFTVLLPQLPEYNQTFGSQTPVNAVQYIDES